MKKQQTYTVTSTIEIVPMFTSVRRYRMEPTYRSAPKFGDSVNARASLLTQSYSLIPGTMHRGHATGNTGVPAPHADALADDLVVPLCSETQGTFGRAYEHSIGSCLRGQAGN